VVVGTVYATAVPDRAEVKKEVKGGAGQIGNALSDHEGKGTPAHGSEVFRQENGGNKILSERWESSITTEKEGTYLAKAMRCNR